MDPTQEAELLTRFEGQFAAHADWREALRESLGLLTPDDHRTFLRERKGPHELTLRVFIPIMVVNGRMNHAEVDADGNIGDIVPRQFAIAGGYPDGRQRNRSYREVSSFL